MLGADDHGGQLALGRVHGLTAVEPQRLGIGHHAGAEHIFKIFQDLDRDFIDLRGKTQRHGSLFLPDGGLQSLNGHGGCSFCHKIFNHHIVPFHACFGK